MLQIKNLTKKYPSRGEYITALDGVTFTLEPGKIYGLLGPNGAGKSTCMNIIAGCEVADSGTVSFRGDTQGGIGYAPEIPALYPDMTVVEYLAFIGQAKGLAGDELIAEINTVTDMMGITGVNRRLTRLLSRGTRQRVGIAGALMASPAVIILDEPAAGLDAEQIVALRKVLLSMKEERIILLSSHILHETSLLCDHVLIINKGRLVANQSLTHMTAGNTIRVTFVGEHETILSKVKSVDGVTSAKIRKTGGEFELVAQVAPGADLREAVSVAVTAGGGTILGMGSDGQTLEGAYLQVIDNGQLTMDN